MGLDDVSSLTKDAPAARSASTDRIRLGGSSYGSDRGGLAREVAISLPDWGSPGGAWRTSFGPFETLSNRSGREKKL